MAFITTSTPFSIADRIRAAMQQFRESRAKRAVYLRTVRELEALNGRDLEDLGISRHSIRDLAYEHTYGK